MKIVCTRSLLFVAVAISFCLFEAAAFAQANSAPSSSDATGTPSVQPQADEPEVQSEPPGPGNVEDFSRMETREFKLSLVIMGFGVLVLLAEFLMLRTMSCTPEQLLRIFVITLIVIGTLLMVPAGFNASAIAPAMGLLGTIAGYLLSQRPADRRDERPRDRSNE